MHDDAHLVAPSRAISEWISCHRARGAHVLTVLRERCSLRGCCSMTMRFVFCCWGEIRMYAALRVNIVKTKISKNRRVCVIEPASARSAVSRVAVGARAPAG